MPLPSANLQQAFPLPSQYPPDSPFYQPMLPANLLLTPPTYVSRLSFFPSQPPLPLAHHMYHHRGMALLLPIVPYMTRPSAKSGLDHLNLSRTVIFKNLSADLSLNDLLSEIDHGPIEYCKMFTSAPPSHIKDVSEVKTCYISFVNTEISVAFFHKYTKSSNNLRLLKDRLKGSKYLKLSLNEPCSSLAQPPAGSNNLSKQDFIKLKTLNYILEQNATRCIAIKFEAASADQFVHIKEKFRSQCTAFGVIEDFKSSANDLSSILKLLVHFTSIDAAIKVFEYYTKQIRRDHSRLLEMGLDKMSFECLLVNFHRDRCDRTELQTPRRPLLSHFQRPGTNSSQASISSSPKGFKHMLNDSITNIPERDESLADGFDEAEAPAVSPLSSPQGLSNDLATPLEEVTLEKKSTEDRNNQEETVNGTVPLSSEGLAVSLESVSVTDSHTSSPSGAHMLPNGASDAYFYPNNRPYVDSSMQHNHHMFAPNLNNPLPMNQMPSYQYNPDPYNVGNRTIFLGNLHPYTQAEEIANNVRAGGLVESINFIRAKRMCFITFIDPAVALKFYLNHQVLHQLIIHGNDVKVSWGRNHSGPLNRDIALAVTAGASRNVYIGVKGGKTNSDEILELPDEQTLREDFSKFGDLEQINFYRNKDCGFINFMNIANAIRLVELMESGNSKNINSIVGDNGEFYEKYRHFKISFGKDRCGNPPKFSFKKKNSTFDYLENSETDILAVDNKRNGNYSRDYSPKQNGGNRSSENAIIDEDTAMVFGITTSPARNADAPKSLESDFESLTDEPQSKQTPSIQSDIDAGLSVQVTGAATDGAGRDSERSTSGSKEENASINGEKLNVENVEGDVHDDRNEDDDDDDEDEDEDDISIIIGSDVTTSSNKNVTPQRPGRNGKARHYLRDAVDTSSQHWYASKNSSTLSLNSNHRKYLNFQPPSFSPMPQPMYMGPYYPPLIPATSRSNSFYGNSMNGSMPQLVHHNSFSGPHMQHATRSYSSFSGSQVMAQYLAKLQHDNFIYATSILANDITPEEMREYSSRRMQKKSMSRSET